MSYQPWKGRLDDGTEILVMVETDHGPDGAEFNDSMAVAFRADPRATWGPPVTLELAP